MSHSRLHAAAATSSSAANANQDAELAIQTITQHSGAVDTALTALAEAFPESKDADAPTKTVKQYEAYMARIGKRADPRFAKTFMEELKRGLKDKPLSAHIKLNHRESGGGAGDSNHQNQDISEESDLKMLRGLLEKTGIKIEDERITSDTPQALQFATEFLERLLSESTAALLPPTKAEATAESEAAEEAAAKEQATAEVEKQLAIKIQKIYDEFADRDFEHYKEIITSQVQTQLKLPEAEISAILEDTPKTRAFAMRFLQMMQEPLKDPKKEKAIEIYEELTSFIILRVKRTAESALSETRRHTIIGNTEQTARIALTRRFEAIIGTELFETALHQFKELFSKRNSDPSALAKYFNPGTKESTLIRQFLSQIDKEESEKQFNIYVKLKASVNEEFPEHPELPTKENREQAARVMKKLAEAKEYTKECEILSAPDGNITFTAEQEKEKETLREKLALYAKTEEQLRIEAAQAAAAKTKSRSSSPVKLQEYTLERYALWKKALGESFDRDSAAGQEEADKMSRRFTDDGEMPTLLDFSKLLEDSVDGADQKSKLKKIFEHYSDANVEKRGRDAAERSEKERRERLAREATLKGKQEALLKQQEQAMAAREQEAKVEKAEHNLHIYLDCLAHAKLDENNELNAVSETQIEDILAKLEAQSSDNREQFNKNIRAERRMRASMRASDREATLEFSSLIHRVVIQSFPNATTRQSPPPLVHSFTRHPGIGENLGGLGIGFGSQPTTPSPPLAAMPAPAAAAATPATSMPEGTIPHGDDEDFTELESLAAKETPQAAEEKVPSSAQQTPPSTPSKGGATAGAIPATPSVLYTPNARFENAADDREYEKYRDQLLGTDLSGRADQEFTDEEIYKFCYLYADIFNEEEFHSEKKHASAFIVGLKEIIKRISTLIDTNSAAFIQIIDAEREEYKLQEAATIRTTVSSERLPLHSGYKVYGNKLPYYQAIEAANTALWASIPKESPAKPQPAGDDAEQFSSRRPPIKRSSSSDNVFVRQQAAVGKHVARNRGRRGSVVTPPVTPKATGGTAAAATQPPRTPRHVRSASVVVSRSPIAAAPKTRHDRKGSVDAAAMRAESEVMRRALIERIRNEIQLIDHAIAAYTQAIGMIIKQHAQKQISTLFAIDAQLKQISQQPLAEKPVTDPTEEVKMLQSLRDAKHTQSLNIANLLSQAQAIDAAEKAAAEKTIAEIDALAKNIDQIQQKIQSKIAELRALSSLITSSISMFHDLGADSSVLTHQITEIDVLLRGSPKPIQTSGMHARARSFSSTDLPTAQSEATEKRNELQKKFRELSDGYSSIMRRYNETTEQAKLQNTKNALATLRENVLLTHEHILRNNQVFAKHKQEIARITSHKSSEAISSLRSQIRILIVEEVEPVTNYKGLDTLSDLQKERSRLESILAGLQTTYTAQNEVIDMNNHVFEDAKHLEETRLKQEKDDMQKHFAARLKETLKRRDDLRENIDASLAKLTQHQSNVSQQLPVNHELQSALTAHIRKLQTIIPLLNIESSLNLLEQSVGDYDQMLLTTESFTHVRRTLAQGLQAHNETLGEHETAVKDIENAIAQLTAQIDQAINTAAEAGAREAIGSIVETIEREAARAKAEAAAGAAAAAMGSILASTYAKLKATEAQALAKEKERLSRKIITANNALLARCVAIQEKIEITSQMITKQYQRNSSQLQKTTLTDLMTEIEDVHVRLTNIEQALAKLNNPKLEANSIAELKQKYDALRIIIRANNTALYPLEGTIGSGQLVAGEIAKQIDLRIIESAAEAAAGTAIGAATAELAAERTRLFAEARAFLETLSNSLARGIPGHTRLLEEQYRFDIIFGKEDSRRADFNELNNQFAQSLQALQHVFISLGDKTEQSTLTSASLERLTAEGRAILGLGKTDTFDSFTAQIKSLHQAVEQSAMHVVNQLVAQNNQLIILAQTIQQHLAICADPTHKDIVAFKRYEDILVKENRILKRETNDTPLFSTEDSSRTLPMYKQRIHNNEKLISTYTQQVKQVEESAKAYTKRKLDLEGTINQNKTKIAALKQKVTATLELNARTLEGSKSIEELSSVKNWKEPLPIDKTLTPPQLISELQKAVGIQAELIETLERYLAKADEIIKSKSASLSAPAATQPAASAAAAAVSEDATRIHLLTQKKSHAIDAITKNNLRLKQQQTTAADVLKSLGRQSDKLSDKDKELLANLTAIGTQVPSKFPDMSARPTLPELTAILRELNTIKESGDRQLTQNAATLESAAARVKAIESISQQQPEQPKPQVGPKAAAAKTVIELMQPRGGATAGGATAGPVESAAARAETERLLQAIREQQPILEKLADQTAALMGSKPHTAFRDNLIAITRVPGRKEGPQSMMGIEVFHAHLTQERDERAAIIAERTRVLREAEKEYSQSSEHKHPPAAGAANTPMRNTSTFSAEQCTAALLEICVQIPPTLRLLEPHATETIHLSRAFLLSLQEQAQFLLSVQLLSADQISTARSCIGAIERELLVANTLLSQVPHANTTAAAAAAPKLTLPNAPSAVAATAGGAAPATTTNKHVTAALAAAAERKDAPAVEQVERAQLIAKLATQKETLHLLRKKIMEVLPEQLQGKNGSPKHELVLAQYQKEISAFLSSLQSKKEDQVSADMLVTNSQFINQKKQELDEIESLLTPTDRGYISKINYDDKPTMQSVEQLELKQYRDDVQAYINNIKVRGREVIAEKETELKEKVRAKSEAIIKSNPKEAAAQAAAIDKGTRSIKQDFAKKSQPLIDKITKAIADCARIQVGTLIPEENAVPITAALVSYLEQAKKGQKIVVRAALQDQTKFRQLTRLDKIQYYQEMIRQITALQDQANVSNKSELERFKKQFESLQSTNACFSIIEPLAKDIAALSGDKTDTIHPIHARKIAAIRDIIDELNGMHSIADNKDAVKQLSKLLVRIKDIEDDASENPDINAIEKKLKTVRDDFKKIFRKYAGVEMIDIVEREDSSLLIILSDEAMQHIQLLREARNWLNELDARLMAAVPASAVEDLEGSVSSPAKKPVLDVEAKAAEPDFADDPLPDVVNPNRSLDELSDMNLREQLQKQVGKLLHEKTADAEKSTTRNAIKETIKTAAAPKVSVTLAVPSPGKIARQAAYKAAHASSSPHTKFAAPAAGGGADVRPPAAGAAAGHRSQSPKTGK